MNYPKIMRIRQHFESPVVVDVAESVRGELSRLPLQNKIKPGDTIAVTVGSRGIANMALIIKTLVEVLKAHGASPFIVPAMGSHGGGEASAQQAIVEAYGVTEHYTGAPIRATMEVVQLGSTEDGIPVYLDKYAFEANHVVVVGRVKSHTDFFGEIESGLHKMMLIGLGKHRGASIYHQTIARYGFEYVLRSASRVVLEKCPILLGLAIVENQSSETAIIQGVEPQEFFECERKLLLKAKELAPRLPFRYVDLLIIDQLGKDISGTGMDTNVIGRKHHEHSAAEHEYPKVTRIFVRDLTAETRGNATGIGIAEFTHTRLVKKIDSELTYINSITGFHPAGAAIPMYYDTDKQVIESALDTVGCLRAEDVRIIRIRNTLDLKEAMVSQSYLGELRERRDLEIIEQAREMEFDEHGDLLPF